MDQAPILSVVFYLTDSQREPAREWLRGLDREDRRLIGEDIKLVQFRWPLGMPVVGKIEPDLWELRTHVRGGRIARTFFTVRSGQMALLHGIMKKSRKTPREDLKTARRRKRKWLEGWHHEQAQR